METLKLNCLTKIHLKNGLREYFRDVLNDRIVRLKKVSNKHNVKKWKYVETLMNKSTVEDAII